VVALVTKQTVTVSSGATESKALDPEAPQVDFLDDPTAGEYTSNAYIAAYFDSSGDGNKDTLVTDSTDTQYTGTFGTEGSDVTSVELNETAAGGDVDVEIWTVARYGYAKIQKRNSGRGNVTQSLQNEDSVTWAFSDPDDPDSDRQITWDSKNSGPRGVLPPKFKLDVVYYDDTQTVEIDEENATNWHVSIPMNQRPIGSDEDPADLRRRITNSMVGE
jgi:hypothetical protein